MFPVPRIATGSFLRVMPKTERESNPMPLFVD
jgi:hypothetical protein